MIATPPSDLGAHSPSQARAAGNAEFCMRNMRRTLMNDRLQPTRQRPPHRSPAAVALVGRDVAYTHHPVRCSSFTLSTEAGPHDAGLSPHRPHPPALGPPRSPSGFVLGPDTITFYSMLLKTVMLLLTGHGFTTKCLAEARSAPARGGGLLELGRQVNRCAREYPAYCTVPEPRQRVGGCREQVGTRAFADGSDTAEAAHIV